MPNQKSNGHFATFTSKFHINSLQTLSFELTGREGEKENGGKGKQKERDVWGKRLSSECGAYEIEKLQADFTRWRKENGKEEERERKREIEKILVKQLIYFN